MSVSKLVDGDERGLAEMGGAVEVGREVLQPLLDGRRVGRRQLIEREAAVHFQCPDGRHEDDRGRIEPGRRGT